MLSGDFKKDVLPLCNKLLRFAFQILQDEEEAKDVLQDIYLKLWQKRDDLGKVENMEAFAMRMIRNRCLDVVRAKHTVSVEVLKKTSLHGEVITETNHHENS